MTAQRGAGRGEIRSMTKPKQRKKNRDGRHLTIQIEGQKPGEAGRES